MAGPRITHHAIERYTERVDPGASQTEARLAIGRIAALGRVRAVPRHWMRDSVNPAPGVRFIYCADRAGVCLVVYERAIVTVITRRLCHQTRRTKRLQLVPPSAGRPVSASERARWRWNGSTDQEAA